MYARLQGKAVCNIAAKKIIESSLGLLLNTFLFLPLDGVPTLYYPIFHKDAKRCSFDHLKKICNYI